MGFYHEKLARVSSDDNEGVSEGDLDSTIKPNRLHV